MERVTEAAWIGIALLAVCVYFKAGFLLLEPRSFVVRSLPGGAWSWAGFASLFASDALLALGILTPALALLGLAIPRRARLALALVLLQATLLWLIVVNVSYNATHELPSLQLLLDALKAFRADPAIMSPRGLMSASKFARLAAMSLGLVGAVLLASRVRSFPPWSRLAMLGSLAVVVALAGFAAGRREDTSRYFRSYLQLAGSAFFYLAPRESVSQLGPTDRDRFLARYRAATFPDGFPTESALPPSPPRPKRPDVIWIVLETAAFEDYRLDEPAADLPAIGRLLPHALVSRNHLSTARLSVKADLALLASLADGPGREWLVRRLRDAGARFPDAAPALLSRRGYRTLYFYPARFTFPADRWLVEMSGFQEISSGGGSSPWTDQSRESRINAESSMWTRAAGRIAALCARDRPYFAVIRSAIGHFPFIDSDQENGRLAGPGTRTFHTVRRILDSGVGGVIAALDLCGSLEDTLILLVGDHGPRFAAEDERLRTDLPTARTFRVPFLLYDARGFPEPRTVPWPTSHVDVLPTVLWLLGAGHGKPLHEGLPMLDARLALRATPFFPGLAAGDRAVVTGLAWGNRFLLYDPYNGIALRSPRLAFKWSQRIPDDDPDAEQLRATFEELRKLNLQLPSLLAVPGSPDEPSSSGRRSGKSEAAPGRRRAASPRSSSARG